MDPSYRALIKEVSHALRLDKDNKFKEAYIKYLTCVLRIVTKLLKEGELVTDVPQYIKLGQQCLERIMAFLDSSQQKKAQMSKETTAGDLTSDCSIQSSSISSSSQQLGVKPDPRQPEPRKGKSRSLSGNNEMDLLAKQTLHRSVKDLTPVELAYKQNKQLMVAYKQRLERTAGKLTLAANLSLTLQRKMAENLAIAKAQEEALAKKMKERHQRLEEQAAKRFNTPTGMSTEEQEQRQTYKKVLEYEQDTVKFTELRKQLEENPNDSIMIQQLIKLIFSQANHPLTLKLKQYQYKIYEKSYSLVSRKLDTLEKIRVPLPEQLHPFEKKGTSVSLTDSMRGDETESSFSSGIDSDLEIKNETTGASNEEKMKDEDIFYDNEDNSTKLEDEPQNDSSSSSDSEDKIVEECKELVKDFTQNNQPETVDRTLENITYDTKADITKALEEGRTCQDKLTAQVTEANIISSKVADEYEKYSEENMDDLFEDDDSDNSHQISTHDSLSYKYISKSCPSESKKILPDSKHLNNTSSHSDYESDNIDQSFQSYSSITKSSEREHTSGGKSSHGKKSISNYSDIDAKKLEALRNEAYHRHLKGVSEDVHMYMEKLQVLFTIAYEELDSPEGRDQCYATLEEAFFTPIWQYLLALFRLTNEPKEIAAAYVMTVKSKSLPQDFGVVAKLCLPPSGDAVTYPYKAAVDELCRLTDQSTLLKKLECVVKVSRLVCQCVDDYYQLAKDSESRDRTPSIGADDLLPILTYVIIRCRLPQIVSECHMMEEFIHEGYIMGEEGYCLTSLQTALSYIVTLGTTKQ
ncbi:hypothetical protein ScPMuIL_000367 [Solemya velum]